MNNVHDVKSNNETNNAQGDETNGRHELHAGQNPSGARNRVSRELQGGLYQVHYYLKMRRSA